LVASTIRRALCGSNAVLLLLAQAGEQRHDLDPRRVVLAQLLGSLANLALAGQEDEDVAASRGAGDPARRSAPELVDGLADRVVQIELAALLERTPALLDREQASRHLDHRRGAVPTREVLCEAVGIDRRRCHDDLQVGPAR
jgi:hypothetical protein